MDKEKKWYKSFGNWLFIVICVVLGLFLVMNFSIMLQAKKDQDKVPSIFGYKPFLVLSGSMETEILKGDLIITKIVDPETVKVDDVIAFRDAENTVTTHRIIDTVVEDGEKYFITKGDNNSTQDLNLVSLNDIEGIYVGRIPGIGSVMKSLSEPTTIAIVILGVTVLFAIGFSISNRKQRELERLEFLEYKRMKEEMLASNKTKKTKSKKAVEDDEELLEEEDIPQPKKRKTSTTTKKTTTVKKSTSSSTPKKTTANKKTSSSKTKTESKKTEN